MLHQPISPFTQLQLRITLVKFYIEIMAEFKVVLETISGKKSCLNLFDKIEASDSEDFEVIDASTEYLMYLTGEQLIDKEAAAKKKETKAEIIIIVDKSGSMQGTPWKQVQSALIQMLDLVKTNNHCQAIAYNQSAQKLPLLEDREENLKLIQGTRAGGSTNFVAVFKLLEKIFQTEAKDVTTPYYIFMMTDGNDTCNNKKEILTAKEHLQAAIAKFGGNYFNISSFLY